MDSEVRAEYESILAEVVIDRGTLVRTDPSIHGWGERLTVRQIQSGGPAAHLGKCRVAKHGAPVESEWFEFAGTFAGCDTRHGVDLPGVSCACGELVDRTLRLETPVHNLAKEIFSRLYRRTRPAE